MLKYAKVCYHDGEVGYARWDEENRYYYQDEMISVARLDEKVGRPVTSHKLRPTVRYFANFDIERETGEYIAHPITKEEYWAYIQQTVETYYDAQLAWLEEEFHKLKNEKKETLKSMSNR